MDKIINFLKHFGVVVIGVSGKKGAGKDLFYTLIKAMSPSSKRVAFADYLKHIARQQFNLSIEQTDGHLKEKPTQYPGWTPRKIMIELGQFYRQIDPMYWVKKAFEVIKGMPRGAIVVITDVRFPNEADFIKKCGGFMVRLERSNNKREEIYPGCSNETNISETALDSYEKFNYIIPANKNENPQQLQQQVEKIVYEILQTAKTLV